MSIAKLLVKLGSDVGIIYVDSQPMLKLKVATEGDVIVLDSQATKAKTRVGRDSQANRREQDDSQAKLGGNGRKQIDSQAEYVVIGGRRFKKPLG